MNWQSVENNDVSVENLIQFLTQSYDTKDPETLGRIHQHPDWWFKLKCLEHEYIKNNEPVNKILKEVETGVLWSVWESEKMIRSKNDERVETGKFIQCHIIKLKEDPRSISYLDLNQGGSHRDVGGKMPIHCPLDYLEQVPDTRYNKGEDFYPTEEDEKEQPYLVWRERVRNYHRKAKEKCVE